MEQVEKGSLDEMRPIMLELARTHIGNGVVDAHFDVSNCPEPRILSNHSHIYIARSCLQIFPNSRSIVMI